MRHDSPLARPHAPPRRRIPWGLLALFLFFGLLGAGVAARLTFQLLPPHAVLPPAAVLGADKRAALDQELDFNRPFDRDQAIDFALGYTADSLTFSLAGGRPPSFDFGVGKRKGGDAEHAALFVAVFEAASRKAGSSARAYRVRSPLRVFGKPVRVPGLSGFADHDWVLVFDPADGARIALDPTLYDALLAATLTRNVRGVAAITIPADDATRPTAPAASPPTHADEARK